MDKEEYSFETPECRLVEDVRVSNMPTLSYAYGALNYAAKYCGFDHIPHPVRGKWQHGWLRRDLMVDPALVIWDDGGTEKNEFHWVSRKDIEVYLRKHGFPYATSIGLGFNYVPDIDVERLPNSLLVMPTHSLYTSEHAWDFDLYCREINEIRDQFDYITVCIHPACLQKKYWIEPFLDNGYEVVTGALFAGNHALYRMKWLFSRFEYMTTNSLGTNVGYAAYAGAKPSLYGSLITVRRDDKMDQIELFQKRPHIPELLFEHASEEAIRRNYPELFCHPKEALDLRDWGRDQLGEDQKRSPSELCDLFGWPRQSFYAGFKEWSEAPTVIEQDHFKPQLDKPGGFLKALKEKDAGLRYRALFQRMQQGRKGNAQACYDMHLVYCYGLAGFAPEEKEAFYWALKAAELGHQVAVLFVMIAYTGKYGVEANPEELKRWASVCEVSLPDEIMSLMA